MDAALRSVPSLRALRAPRSLRAPRALRLSAVLASLAGCGVGDGGDTGAPRTAGAAPWFEEVATASGIDFVHRSGMPPRYAFPEVACGGVGLLDYDDDGLLDVYFVQGGALEPDATERPGNRLFQNAPGLRFRDVTQATGTGDASYGMGCAAGDYDGDGRVDLYVTNLGANVLYRNEGARFADVTAASNTGDPRWGASVAFVDTDQDGDLDLFVVNYIHWTPETDLACTSGTGEREYCDPNSFQAPARDTLLRNDGGGRFTDATKAAGIDAAFGNGLGVACADYDADGWIDVYVANDGMPNQLWVNAGDGTFVDRALAMGCAVNADSHAEAGMGVMAVDVEDDGDIDLYVSHLREETNTMYLNNGKWFDDVTARTGLGPTSYPFTGFGLGFHDFDHDGRLDVYVANGRVKRGSPTYGDDVLAEPNLVFVSKGETGPGGRLAYAELAPRGGTAETLLHASRAAAFGDLDDDGDQDVVVVNKDAAPYVLRNVVGDRGAWAVFRVTDAAGHTALDAALELEAGGRRQHRRVQRTYSYCASNDPRVHFGLGTAPRVDRVSVRWPGGATEVFGPFATNAMHDLRQGTGRAD